MHGIWEHDGKAAVHKVAGWRSPEPGDSTGTALNRRGFCSNERACLLG